MGKFFQPFLAAAVGLGAGKNQEKFVGFEGNLGAEIRVQVSNRKPSLGAVFALWVSHGFGWCMQWKTAAFLSELSCLCRALKGENQPVFVP